MFLHKYWFFAQYCEENSVVNKNAYRKTLLSVVVP